MLKEFKNIIGNKSYSTFLDMLKAIGPDARTHRISVVIGAMLRFACNKCIFDGLDGKICHALITIDNEPFLVAERTDEYEILSELIDNLCKEASMANYRESARGESYSIAENAIAEYASWYNMPWEDYYS
jgi:hypothetical protein